MLLSSLLLCAVIQVAGEQRPVSTGSGAPLLARRPALAHASPVFGATAPTPVGVDSPQPAASSTSCFVHALDVVELVGTTMAEVVAVSMDQLNHLVIGTD